MNGLIVSSIAAAAGVTAQVRSGYPSPPFRPFIDPLEMHGSWWLLLPPLALGIAMVYKAVKLKDLSRYWFQVVVMTLQIIAGMLLLGVASYLLVELFVPLVASHAAR